MDKVKFKTEEEYYNYFINELELEDVTSKRQNKNGTKMFFDPLVSTETEKVYYTMHSQTGYYRRRTLFLTGKYMARYRHWENYQLNPIIHSFTNYRKFSITERILINNFCEQYFLIQGPILNFRNSK